MKNADTPAMPTQYMDLTQGGGELYCDHLGLTKREMFAMHAMSAQISAMGSIPAMEMFTEAMNERGIPLGEPERLVAINAINYADALLKELEK